MFLIYFDFACNKLIFFKMCPQSYCLCSLIFSSPLFLRVRKSFVLISVHASMSCKKDWKDATVGTLFTHFSDVCLFFLCGGGFWHRLYSVLHRVFGISSKNKFPLPIISDGAPFSWFVDFHLGIAIIWRIFHCARLFYFLGWVSSLSPNTLQVLIMSTDAVCCRPFSPKAMSVTPDPLPLVRS